MYFFFLFFSFVIDERFFGKNSLQFPLKLFCWFFFYYFACLCLVLVIFLFYFSISTILRQCLLLFLCRWCWLCVSLYWTMVVQIYHYFLFTAVVFFSLIYFIHCIPLLWNEERYQCKLSYLCITHTHAAIIALYTYLVKYTSNTHTSRSLALSFCKRYMCIVVQHFHSTQAQHTNKNKRKILVETQDSVFTALTLNFMRKNEVKTRSVYIVLFLFFEPKCIFNWMAKHLPFFFFLSFILFYYKQIHA